MSSIATETLWKVTLTEGILSDLREGEWLFTNERAAKAFVKAAERVVEPRYMDVSIEKVDAYKTGIAARFQAWPFSEIIKEAEGR